MNAVDVRATASASVRSTGGAAADPLRIRWAWWRSRAQRTGLHRRSLLTPSPAGCLHLPGTRVETLLVEAPDPYRRPCALVLVPATGHLSAALDITLPGAAAPAPQDDIRGSSASPRVAAPPPAGQPRPLDPGWTADAGAWLALLTHEPGLAGCAIALQRTTDRPELQVLVQLTWQAPALVAGADPAAAAVEVLARIPRFVQSLARGAVGTARPLSAGELAAVVRDAYHPARDGGDLPGPEPWSDAGPVGAAESWEQFRHGPVASRTWALNRVPPSVVLETVVPSLDAVPRGTALTRVTLLHHPGRAGARRTAEHPTEIGPARLASLVTVTATPDELPVAAAALLDRLPAALRPWLRPVYGSQAAALAAGLPAGVLLTAHASPPGLQSGSDERGL